MNILEVSTVEQARCFTLGDFKNRLISREEFIHLFKLFGAFWQFPGEPSPAYRHAITKAGDHTDGFINCLEVLKESNLCTIMADQAVRRLKIYYPDKIDWVISAAYAGIDFGHEIARLLNARHAFVEKDDKGAPTLWKRLVIPRGEIVLVVNELMTTAAGSTWETKKAVMKSNEAQPVEFVPYAVLMVNRSKADEALVDGTPIVSVARFQMDTYKPNPEGCPYCKAGSQALKPKVEGNWAKYFQNP